MRRNATEKLVDNQCPVSLITTQQATSTVPEVAYFCGSRGTAGTALLGVPPIGGRGVGGHVNFDLGHRASVQQTHLSIFRFVLESTYIYVFIGLFVCFYRALLTL